MASEKMKIFYKLNIYFLMNCITYLNMFELNIEALNNKIK